MEFSIEHIDVASIKVRPAGAGGQQWKSRSPIHHVNHTAQEVRLLPQFLSHQHCVSPAVLAYEAPGGNASLVLSVKQHHLRPFSS